VIARIQKHLANEIERLLRAGRNHYVLGVRFDSIARHIGGNQFAKRFVTLGGAILQSMSTLLAKHFFTRLLKSLHGKRIGGGKASRKRNDVWL